jgi:AraC family transcriptional regulator of adaptative response/methylated-DNA-[protein]-cysteine methyltransferase
MATTTSQLLSTSEYGAYGRGARIGFAITDSPIGRILVAGTRRGICFAAIGGERASDRGDDYLIAELRSDFREADSISRADDDVTGWAAALAKYAAGETAMPSLPLDVRGTEFQLRIWRELVAIPAGTTRTYGEVARRAGNAAAARATGAAVGANPVTILIPCHRAVAFDGALHNYRWGLEAKRRLLEIEAFRH